MGQLSLGTAIAGPGLEFGPKFEVWGGLGRTGANSSATKISEIGDIAAQQISRETSCKLAKKTKKNKTEVGFVDGNKQHDRNLLRFQGLSKNGVVRGKLNSQLSPILQ